MILGSSSRFSFPKVSSMLATVALLSLVCVAPNTAHAQSLNGQAITVNRNYPTMSNNYAGMGTNTVNPAGVTFSYGPENVLVKPSQVVFTFGSDNIFFVPVSFNGYQITESGGSPVTFTSVTIDPSTNLAGFDASRIVFDGTNIFANFQGLLVNRTDTVTLNLGFAPAVTAVPEPGEWATMGIACAGLSGLMIRAHRKKANSKASHSATLAV